jgi:hypothetical protein
LQKANQYTTLSVVVNSTKLAIFAAMGQYPTKDAFHYAVQPIDSRIGGTVSLMLPIATNGTWIIALYRLEGDAYDTTPVLASTAPHPQAHESPRLADDRERVELSIVYSDQRASQPPSVVVVVVITSIVVLLVTLGTCWLAAIIAKAVRANDTLILAPEQQEFSLTQVVGDEEHGRDELVV